MKGFELRSDGFYYAPSIDPQDEMDYKLDVTGILNGIGSDTVQSCSWAVDPTGITIVTAKNTNDATSASVWLKQATLGGTWLVTGSFITAGGRKFDRSFKIECKSA